MYLEDIIADLQLFSIIFGIPLIFLFLCISNIVKIIKSKKNKEIVKKSFIIKSILFGVIFILIVYFYISFIYGVSQDVSESM
ncbi:MAG: hypothetical protein K6D97_07920 [Clostridia bacterium]|nr:hypothetical protein [Clostridia bacterium]